MRRVVSIFGTLLLATAAGAQDTTLGGLWQRGLHAYVASHDYRLARAIMDSIVARDSAAMARGDSTGLGSFGNPWSLRSQARAHLGDAPGASQDLEYAL